MAATNFTKNAIGKCNCSTSCTTTFNVRGCNGLNYQGATVSIYDHSGGTLLASGTTNSSGNATLTFAVSSFPYWLTIAGSARLSSVAQNFSQCGGTATFTLTPAAGYACIGGCVLPVATTLFASLTCGLHCNSIVNITLTYNSSTNQWSGSSGTTGVEVSGAPGNQPTVLFSGGPCPFTPSYTITCPPSFNITFDGTTIGGTTTCQCLFCVGCTITE